MSQDRLPSISPIHIQQSTGINISQRSQLMTFILGFCFPDKECFLINGHHLGNRPVMIQDNQCSPPLNPLQFGTEMSLKL